MIALEFKIPPIAKGRPRRGRNGAMYTPQASREFENALQILAREKYGVDTPPVKGAIGVEVMFVVSKPQSVQREYPSCKPDIDNLIKSLDALNGVVWKDDAQIIDLTASKRYCLPGESPGIYLRVDTDTYLEGA